MPLEVSISLLNYTYGRIDHVLRILNQQQQHKPVMNQILHYQLQQASIEQQFHYEDNREGDRLLIDQFISIVPGRSEGGDKNYKPVCKFIF